MANPTAAQRAAARLAKRELATMEPAMRRAFIQSIGQLLRTLPAETLAARIKAGLPLSDLIPPRTLDRAFMPMQAAMREDAARGFRVATGLLNPQTGARGGGFVGISFNTLSPRVLAGIVKMEDFVLKAAKTDVRETVRMAVENGLKSGKSPRDVARGVRDVIGLAPNHEQHVRNFRRKLEAVANGSRDAFDNKLRDKRFDAAIKTALKNGQGLAAPVIDNMVEAYARRYVAWHAETVAKTATMNAYRAGQAASIEAAVEMDIMEPQDIVKIWTTVGDDKVRDEHVAMEGEEVPYDQPFSNGLTIPSEWNCRCIVLYEFRPKGSRSREEALKLMRARDKGDVPKPEPKPEPMQPPPPPPPPPQRTLGERLVGPETAAETAWLDKNAKPRDFNDVMEGIRTVRTQYTRQSPDLDISGNVPMSLANRVRDTGRDLDELFGPLTRDRTRIEFGMTREAWHDPRTNTIRYGPGFYQETQTIAHELTHAYQARYTAIVDWERSMYAKYAPGASIRDIRPLVAPGMKEQVVGYVSPKFVRPYQGRVYPKSYGTISGTSVSLWAAEFLTVAMELFYTDTRRFAQDFPEMYRDLLKFFYRINTQ